MTKKAANSLWATHAAGPVGLCVLPSPARHRGRSVCHPDYMHEILSHAGLCHRTIPFAELGDRLRGISVLVTVGETELSAALRRRLRKWVEKGGSWISIGGTCGLEDLLGVEHAPAAYSGWGIGLSVLGEGYLSPSKHPVCGAFDLPLHFFGGISVKAAKGKLVAGVTNAHQHDDPRAGIVENVVGKGRCILIATDVTGTIVHIQQGTAVTRDGIPAPDGSALRNELALKCDDGIVLDWIFDREPVAGIPGLSAFMQPVADQWREVVVRSILHVAKAAEVPLPVLWLYPRNLPMLAHMSHDSDLNEPEKAQALMDLLAELDINTSWCIQLPGYRRHVYRAIAEAGHELAMHFDVFDESRNPWTEKEFQRQFAALEGAFGGCPPITNKNHYTLWQGDTEFFDWCSRAGIRMDQTKGPSKTGEAGFPFGTCHPYLPVAPNGSLYDVFELPFQTQDLNVFAPLALAAALLPPVLKHHGILHLLFHPAHIDKPGVAEAITSSVQQAEAVGAEWWTGERIDTWERTRRRARWEGYAVSSKKATAELRAGALQDATVLWLGSSSTTFEVNGRAADSVRVKRWGFDFHAVVLGKASRGRYRVEAITKK